MSEEDFLKRWSRRKREVAKDDDAARAPASDPAAQTPDAAREVETQFDPASLPSIESITALSDVTAFLQAGVPAELTRAALRHVWTADPSIRDFVGLAENAWDFTDPNAMPGFGPLEATEEVRRMIARVVGEIGRAAQPVEEDVVSPRAADAESSNDPNALTLDPAAENECRSDTHEEKPKQKGSEALADEVSLQSNIENSALQYDVTEAQEKPKQFSYRAHGGALPR
jgi:hypothetical protein